MFDDYEFFSQYKSLVNPIKPFLFRAVDVKWNTKVESKDKISALVRTVAYMVGSALVLFIHI